MYVIENEKNYQCLITLMEHIADDYNYVYYDTVFRTNRNNMKFLVRVQRKFSVKLNNVYIAADNGLIALLYWID